MGTSSGPMPRRAATPGRNPSSTTSARAQSARARPASRFRSQTTDSLPRAQRVVPSRSRAPQRVAVRRLDADDARAEPQQLTARERTGEVPRQVDDEHPGERLLRGVCHRTYSDRTLTDRSIARERASGDRQAGSEEKRRLILDAAVRVFARRRLPHVSRSATSPRRRASRTDCSTTTSPRRTRCSRPLFRENWGELLGRFARVEAVRRARRRAAARDRQDPAAHVAERPRPRPRDGARGRSQLAPAGAGRRDRPWVRDDPAGDRARPGRGRLPAPTSTRGSRAGSSTVGSRRSSRAGCSGSFPTATRRSPVPSGRSSTSSAAVSSGRRSSPEAARARTRSSSGSGALGLAWSLTTTAAYLPPILGALHGLDDPRSGSCSPPRASSRSRCRS